MFDKNPSDSSSDNRPRKRAPQAAADEGVVKKDAPASEHRQVPQDARAKDGAPEVRRSASRQSPRNKKRERRASLPQKDILPILKGWDYESGTINVRKITGLDGSPKLQMRLDLGVLQMEIDGRPDGQRPFGFESLLDYYEKQLSEHRDNNGTEIGFHLTGDECQSLREEAAMYYRRYLSLYVLSDFSGVIRDTDRNLRVLDLCGKYAVDQEDRLVLEQYRPYIIMMNCRATAMIHSESNRPGQALAALRAGLRTIRAFFARFGHEEAYHHSNEVRVLRRFAREIKRKLPVDPTLKLQRQLDKAVQNEHFEEAARLRDMLRELQRQTTAQPNVPGETEP